MPETVGDSVLELRVKCYFWYFYLLLCLKTLFLDCLDICTGYCNKEQLYTLVAEAEILIYFHLKKMRCNEHFHVSLRVFNDVGSQNTVDLQRDSALVHYANNSLTQKSEL